MKPTWRRASGALTDNESREDTLSIFWDYDLLCWTFGPRFEIDPCWFDFVIELGPVRVSFCYFRAYVASVTDAGAAE